MIGTTDKEPRVKEGACPRCGGFMVWTFTEGLEPGCEGESLALRRCVNCGELLEEQILANRLRELESKRQEKPSPRFRYSQSKG